jgi:hypothetical protein
MLVQVLGRDWVMPMPILPEGSTLTVYGTNGYRRIFAGGQQPPWKR